MFIELCKNEGNLDLRNMLSDSRKKIIDQNKTRLRHVQVCQVLRSSGKNIKETRWQVSWKDPQFSW